MLTRRLQPELMDDPSLDPAEHARALAGLARINRISLAGRAIWQAIERAGASSWGQDITILDIACGSGDVLEDVILRARSAGIRLSARACDISPVALEQTRGRLARNDFAVETIRRDVVRDGLRFGPASIDIVMNSLFLHHLSKPDITAVLREMSIAARRIVVISDLRRCLPGLLAAHIAGQALTRSRIVRVDAVRSAHAALSPHELATSAAAAGMPTVRISRIWPMRMLAVWTPPQPERP